MKIATWDFSHKIKQKCKLNASIEEVCDYCGHNLGNLVHLEAHNKILKNHELISVDLEETEIINNNDYLLIKGANQIGGHLPEHTFDKHIDLIRQIKIPIIVCSIGAQSSSFSNSPHMDSNHSIIRFIKEIFKKNRYNNNYSNISVRGLYTRHFLSTLGIDSNCTGCMSSYLINEESIDNIKHKQSLSIANICVASGDIYGGSVSIQKKLQKIVDDYNGIFIIQSPITNLLITNGYYQNNFLREEHKLLYNKYYKDDNIKDISRWFNKNARYYTNINDWGQTTKLYDFILGTRYHGVKIGIINGTPGTVLGSCTRTAEMCQAAGIKFLDVNDVATREIKEIVNLSKWDDKDLEKFIRKNKKIKEDINNFFLKNGIVL